MNVLDSRDRPRMRDPHSRLVQQQRHGVSNIGLVGAGRSRTRLPRPSRTALGISVQPPDNITHWR